ncbi:unnamed protein product [Alopecurus aequalis]
MDFDNKEMKLYKCTYKLGPIEAPRLIKKGNPVLDYEFISSFRHPAAVQVENYFKKQCLVISMVDGTFAKWLARKEKEHLFTEQGRMLPLLRDMMINLASLVETLIANGKVPTELTLKNVYIRILPDGTPKLQVLVNEVTKSTVDLKAGAWKAARDIFDYCFTSHGVGQDDVTKSFCSFFGTPLKNIQRLLEDFPDQWDNSRKFTFLMESCAHVGEVRYQINFNSSGFAWPLTSQLLDHLIYHSEEKASPYIRTFPYDYVRLGRNGFKHFDDLPPWLKAQLGGNRDGLLSQIEQWTPNIWAKLYVAINSPPQKKRR